MSWVNLPKSFKGDKTKQASEVGSGSPDAAKKAVSRRRVRSRRLPVPRSRQAPPKRARRTEVLMATVVETRELGRGRDQPRREVVEADAASPSPRWSVRDESTASASATARRGAAGDSKAVDDAPELFRREARRAIARSLGRFDAARVLLRPACPVPASSPAVVRVLGSAASATCSRVARRPTRSTC
jgi:hypothetical protein